MPDHLADIADREMLNRLGQLLGCPLDDGDALLADGDEMAKLRAFFQAQRDRLTRDYDNRRKEILAQREASRAEIEARYQSQKERVTDKLAKATRKIRRRYKDRLRAARDARDEAKRTAAEEYERTFQQADENLWCRGEIFSMQQQTVNEMTVAAEQIIDKAGFAAPEEAYIIPHDDESRGPKRRFVLALKRCREALNVLQSQAALQANLQRFTPVLYVVISAGAVLGIGSALGWTGWHWILGGGAGGPLLLLFIAYAVLIPGAKRKGGAAYVASRHAAAHATAAIEQMFEAALAKYRPRETEQVQQRDERIAAAENEWKTIAGALKVTRDRRIQENQAKVKARRDHLINKRQRDLADLEYRFAPQLEILADEHETNLAELLQKQQEQLAGGGIGGDAALSSIEIQTQHHAARLQSAVDELTAYCQDRFPPWQYIDWTTWQAPVDAPSAVKLGHFRSGLAVDSLEIPAVLHYPQRPSLLLVADDEGRSAALDILRNVMLRVLSSFPRGQLRMTAMIPSGLSVPELAPFQPAVEFVEEPPPALVNDDHRSEAPTSLLVVPVFPGPFDEEQIGRIVMQARGGAPVFVCIDPQQAADRNFDTSALAPRAITLEYDEKVFRLADEGLSHLCLSPDEPPSDANIRAVAGLMASAPTNV